MRYEITVVEDPVCISHRLDLPYPSKCASQHGHNYRIEVVIEALELNEHGMVEDFTFIKKELREFDHTHLTLFDPAHGMSINSTAENFGRVLLTNIQCSLKNTAARVKSISLWETPNNKVTIYGD